MNIRNRIISVLSRLGLINAMTRLVRSPVFGRPIRIVLAIWRSGDLPQNSGQSSALSSGAVPASSDFDSVIRGIEECLVRHENALRQIESEVRGDQSVSGNENT